VAAADGYFSVICYEKLVGETIADALLTEAFTNRDRGITPFPTAAGSADLHGGKEDAGPQKPNANFRPDC
jgi:hypothetical protein